MQSGARLSYVCNRYAIGAKAQNATGHCRANPVRQIMGKFQARRLPCIKRGAVFLCSNHKLNLASIAVARIERVAQSIAEQIE